MNLLFGQFADSCLEQNNGSQNGTVELTPCGDGTYCCGSNNLGCCDTDRAFTIPTQSSVVASNVTETVRATVTASSDASTFRSATIGLGAALGVVALMAIGAILWLRRKNSALYKQLTEANAALDSAQQQNQNHGTAMSQTPASHSARPYQESYLGGDTATNATSSPNPQYAYYKQPPMSGSPATPSEIDGQRYSELDATMINADRGSLMTSPMPEEGQFQQQQYQQQHHTSSPRGTPAPAQSPTFGSSPP